MNEPSPPTRTASRDDHPELAAMLVRSFQSDPFHGWLFPDDAVRSSKQRRLFERLLAIYGRHGVVHTTEDRSGVAMWDPPREGGPGLAELAGFVFGVLPVFGWRAFAVAEGMAPLAGLHPDEPHWYLSVLGSDPARQRSGVGSALLRPVLARCDRDGLPACLESSRIENVPYYERFGFEVVAPLPMPRGGPSLYRMKREPRRPARERR